MTQRRSIRWRRDVARRIGRRGSCIGAGLGCGVCSRTNNSANRDTRGDATPVRTSAIVTVAAAAADIHIPVRVDVRIPVYGGVGVSTVRHIPVEVVAVKIAAAASAGGRAPRTAAGGSLTASATASAVLHKNQPGLMRLDSCLYRSRNVTRGEWNNRRRNGAARDRQSSCEQQCVFGAHFSVPGTWLEAL